MRMIYSEVPFLILTSATAFSGCHCHVTQRKSLKIQTCSITIKKNPVELHVKHCKMSSSYVHVYNFIYWDLLSDGTKTSEGSVIFNFGI